MKKIRVFTAFSGYDSQCLALQYLIVVDVLMGIFGQMFNPQPKLDEKQITFPWWW